MDTQQRHRLTYEALAEKEALCKERQSSTTERDATIACKSSEVAVLRQQLASAEIDRDNLAIKAEALERAPKSDPDMVYREAAKKRCEDVAIATASPFIKEID